jgi:hypothetical protein
MYRSTIVGTSHSSMSLRSASSENNAGETSRSAPKEVARVRPPRELDLGMIPLIINHGVFENSDGTNRPAKAVLQ